MTTSVIACIGLYEIEKTAGVAGYDLYLNGDTGRAFVGHHRDRRDCERVAKRGDTPKVSNTPPSVDARIAAGELFIPAERFADING